MKVKVRIITQATGAVEAELTDEYSPNTFRAIIEALPIESIVHTWGDEIYFETPVSVPEENAKEVVEKGTIAYWPPGNSLCIFWGPTPASRTPQEIRPASPVNVVGKVIGDPTVFSKVRDGDRIRVELMK
ncbi:MAG: hypothetical protein DRN15_09205 [Thermoprotei archaeon]|nr:MAG: hypothetical protein DRM97_07740 [Thermoprotei archaeon]RLF22398.1 MAG: hypothetical protein DRN15_09205 [Thermoprotei archaeon]